MTFTELAAKAEAKKSTIEWNNKTYSINLKEQQGFKKAAGKSYVIIGWGIATNIFMTDWVDEDDNCHGHKIPALAYVKVGDAMHRNEFPIYAIANGYEPQQVGNAKMIERK